MNKALKAPTILWRIALAALPLALAGCALPLDAPIVPPSGVLFTHITAPLVLPGASDLGDQIKDAHPVEVYVRIPTPYMPTEVAMGRIDIENAARKSGIKRLVRADYEFVSILVYFKAMTIHAYGYAE